MQTRLSTRRVMELMQQLQQHADRRARHEQKVAAALAEEQAAAAEDFAKESKRVAADHATKRRQLENDFAAAKQEAAAAFERDTNSADDALAAAHAASERHRHDVVTIAEHQAKDAEWQAMAVFDAAKNQPQQLLDDAVKRLKATRRQVEGLLRDARTLIDMRRLTQRAEGLAPAEPTAFTADPANPFPQASSAETLLQYRGADLHHAVITLEGQKTASLFLEGGRSIWAVLILVGVATLIGGIAGGFGLTGLAIGALVGLALGGTLVGFYIPRGRRQSLDQYSQVLGLAAEMQALEQRAAGEAKESAQRMGNEIVRRRDVDVAEARATRARELAAVEAQFAAESAEAEADHEIRITDAAAIRSQSLAAADAKFPPLLEQNVVDREREEQGTLAAREKRLATAQAKHDAAWRALADAWTAGFRAVADELAAMRARSAEFFPDWAGADLATWQRPAEPPEAISLGVSTLPLTAVKNGMPADPRLHPGVDRLELPAVMGLSEQPRLVVTAGGHERREAAEILQLAMLRFLTALPAGKLRFTLIDHAGLGDNFSAFMHLADYDEQLLAGRIWTDPKKIDERLAMLADHMEKVLQKYLRNEFATIQDYNRSAGEVAEPYHVVVAANFPAGFTENAARRLVSIAANGPRCGVYVLTSVDRDLRLPHEFRMDDLLRDSMHLELVGEPPKVVWHYPLFEKLPLALDPLPPPQKLTDTLRIAGQQSKAASKVEVPFSFAAPRADAYWTSDSGRELSIPIGRAGAKEMQNLRLGVGTAQHALISGKTGSGKSTLLHALVTNLALHYGPDQLEFYLVDFKKGVEFKAYANGRLPHARVIAIESEREFGVSVLERLDVELKRRGELFRHYGVQDLAGFRRACPETIMPRTLLVVDEFQELFVADDKLAQDAALLLDRLVRQGRAFGIHVLLGSQTLAGAYSLARSTIGQMAVRIALECSEADSHLILSDENTAARLLTRPGEAIYNDQNGLVAGNHPFQVVWLPDADRQRYLAAMRDLPAAGRVPTDEPPIVFEGNVAANPLDNPELVEAVTRQREQGETLEPTLWLGSAVRIEPPTRLILRRQGGHNLAILGQSEPMAVGILTAAVLGLAGQHGEGGARFTILDGARPESPERGLWPRVANVLGDAAEVFAPREAPTAIAALAEEVARRNASPHERHAARYLVIYDLAQFRDLRLGDDDYGFGFTNGKPPSTDKQFRDILREGPAVGVHTFLWCESFSALSRCIDRMAMRELEFRVAMQMSGADSTSYIDSPAAGLLGEHRAILYRDDLGTLTKFRPYGSPSDEWLLEAGGALNRKRMVVPQE